MATTSKLDCSVDISDLVRSLSIIWKENLVKVSHMARSAYIKLKQLTKTFLVKFIAV